jgi:transcriptional regulator with XRE-family HTH domain
MPKSQILVMKNVKARMARAKPPVTIGQLSIELDMDKSYLARVLRGEMRMHMEHLDALARFFGVEPSALLKK